MAEVTIRISGDKELVRKLNEIQRMVPYKTAWAWRNAINQYFIPAVKERILSGAPDLIWHGDLLNSFAVKSSRKTGQGVVVDVTAVEYAAELEFGQKPKNIIYERIVQWVKDKNGIQDDFRARAIANAVINTLQTKGIEPKNFIVPSFESTKDLMVQSVFDAVRQFVK